VGARHKIRFFWVLDFPVMSTKIAGNVFRLVVLDWRLNVVVIIQKFDHCRCMIFVC